MARNTEIANTILQQLGGRRFVVFTGSKDFMAIENGLKMSLAKNASKANRLEITLNGADLYNMKFYRYTPWRFSTRGGKFTEYPEKITIVKEYKNCYFDQLQELFTETTELYTHF